MPLTHDVHSRQRCLYKLLWYLRIDPCNHSHQFFCKDQLRNLNGTVMQCGEVFRVETSLITPSLPVLHKQSITLLTMFLSSSPNRILCTQYSPPHSLQRNVLPLKRDRAGLSYNVVPPPSVHPLTSYFFGFSRQTPRPTDTPHRVLRVGVPGWGGPEFGGSLVHRGGRKWAKYWA